MLVEVMVYGVDAVEPVSWQVEPIHSSPPARSQSNILLPTYTQHLPHSGMQRFLSPKFSVVLPHALRMVL
jgi:hypothetical protein